MSRNRGNTHLPETGIGSIRYPCQETVDCGTVGYFRVVNRETRCGKPPSATHGIQLVALDQLIGLHGF